MNEKIVLRVTVLNKNFEKKIKICSQIRILNKKKLKKELNKFNLKEEADILKIIEWMDSNSSICSAKMMGFIFLRITWALLQHKSRI